MPRPWFLVWSLVIGGAAALNAQVEEAWTARYDNPDSGSDVAGDIALDADGNVYVAGTTQGLEGYDFAVAKYDPEGSLLWVSSCGASICSDGPSALVVDATDNAYVSGIASSGERRTLVVYKVDQEGRRLWVARQEIDLSVHRPERPALQVDASGRIHVAALASYSRLECQGELAIFTFDADGDELWADRRSVHGCCWGGELSGHGFPFQPVSMAVDQEANVYVAAGNTQVVFDASGNFQWERTAVSGVFTSIAVDSTGESLFVAESTASSVLLHGSDWIAELAHDVDLGCATATALAVDPADRSVYLAVEGGFATKYDSAGNLLWKRPIDAETGCGWGIYGGRALTTLDRSGNVHVTIISSGEVGVPRGQTMVKYDRDGNELWSVCPSSSLWVAQRVGVHGDVHLTGSFLTICPTSPDWDTVKYDASGTELWTVHYDGPGGDCDVASDVAIDPQGNVFVTGAVEDLPGSVTLKYDSTGTLLWDVRRRARLNTELGSTLAVDAAGNAYVASSSWLQEEDCLETVKYAPDGTELWVAQHHEGSGHANALVLGPEGTVYVAGTGYGLPDYATLVTYDEDGHELWTTRSNDASAAYLAVDPAGNAYISGFGSGPLIKYDPDGREVWRAPRAVGAHGLALDPAGNVLVTGYTETAKYDPDGHVVWSTCFLDGLEDAGSTALAIDPAGDIYVAGYSWSERSYIQIIVKYDPDGEELWVARGPEGVPRAVAIDDHGNVYVAGSSSTVKYDAEGNEVWLAGFDGEASAITLDSGGSVYVTGFTPGIGGSDLLTVKYLQTPSIAPRFVRGDSNADGKLNVADPVYTLLYTFAGGETPACLDTADSNDDGEINVADAVFVLQYLFVEGPMIPQPYPGCGMDRTVDALDCFEYAPCD